MQSLVLDDPGICLEGDLLRLRSEEVVISSMFLIDVVVLVDGFICRKVLLDVVENEYTS